MKKNIFITALSISALFSAQKNLISNGGFEYEKESWSGENIFNLSPYVKKTGNSAGSITEFTNPQWKGIDQQFFIPKNTVAVEISGWLKADAIQQGKDAWNKGVMIADLDGKNEVIAEIVGTTNWQEFKKVVPVEKARSGKLMIALSACTGTLYFDDIKITPLKQEDYNKIVEAETAQYSVKVITDDTPLEIINFSNGGFENGLESWRGNAETTAEEKFEGNKSLKITSANPVWYGIDQESDIPSGSVSMDISAMVKTKDLVPGKNDWNKGVMIVAFSKDGTAKTGDNQPVFFVSDAKDWQKFSKNIVIPNGSKKLRIMIALSEATGTMYVDDVQIKYNK